jgi:hypothetical protein
VKIHLLAATAASKHVLMIALAMVHATMDPAHAAKDSVVWDVNF